MTLRACFMITAFLMASVLSKESAAQDKEIAIGNVPEIVLAAAKSAFPGKFQKFLTAEKRTMDKKLVHWSLEIKMKDKTVIDAYFNEEGKLLRTGVSVKPADVPVVVRDAFEKEYKEWHVTELNKETDIETKADFYSVDIDKDGKKLELDFTPEGKIVKILELKDDE